MLRSGSSALVIPFENPFSGVLGPDKEKPGAFARLPGSIWRRFRVVDQLWSSPPRDDEPNPAFALVAKVVVVVAVVVKRLEPI
jgi:hypothetical protein